MELNRSFTDRDPRREPVLLTPQQVACMLQISPRHVRRLAQSGMLERVRVGHRTPRYTLRSVQSFVDLSRYEQRPGGNRGVEHPSGGVARDACPD